MWQQYDSLSPKGHGEAWWWQHHWYWSSSQDKVNHRQLEMQFNSDTKPAGQCQTAYGEEN